MDINTVSQLGNMDVNTISQVGNIVAYKSDNIREATNDEHVNDKTKEVKQKDLDKAVKKLNKFLEDEPVHAEYSVHKELNAIMIKIVDDNTKEVIMEIPSKKILDMIASMCKQVGLIDKKA